MTKAEGSNSLMRAMLKCGRDGIGNPAGSAPKRDWMVSTGSASTATAADAAPNKTVTVSFKATITGIFEIELEHSATQLASLKVLP